MLQKMHRYPAGSVVQYRNGYIKVKKHDGTWASEHRLVAEIKLVGRELREGERVFHKDGDRSNNKADNLVVIKFNMTRYKLLPAARPLFIPKAETRESLLAAR